MTDMHRTRPQLPTAQELATLPPDGGSQWNRLVFESSPYLLQHATNPVDWWPWGDAAFEQARRDNKPIFLSIGYSTCHWCHVMERESFEDKEVAQLLNRNFICIKVDREERPDIDHVYMTVTQALTGSGGWPMTVFLTPDKEPFYAGTYFPRQGAYGRPGMLELLPAIAEAWRKQQADLTARAGDIARAVAAQSSGAPGQVSGATTLDKGYAQLASRFDRRYGGFGNAPKFPTPATLYFLLRYWKRTGEVQALTMVERTLVAMRQGGVYDQIGFGFHRYSTDAQWLVPHFEKMLYDQALLVLAYCEAYQVTGNPWYATVAEEILTYVSRDMTAPEGGFYTAEDADSEGEEGAFYLWTKDEIEAVLGRKEAELFCRVYGVAAGGNYRDEATGTRSGRNILHLPLSLDDRAADLRMEKDDLRLRLSRMRERLFAAREKRVHPLKDDKILTDINGLMIAALARAAQVLDAPRHAGAAQRAADFVLTQLRDPGTGQLRKRYRHGVSGLPAHLEDYAYLTWGLLELYEATFEVHYLRAALSLTDHLLAHYWDTDAGGVFQTSDEGEALFLRGKDAYDGALPSGNAVSALNFLRLERITGNVLYRQYAEGIFRAFGASVEQVPTAHCALLCALDYALGPSLEIVIAGRPNADDTRAMLAAIREPFWPNKVLLLRPEGNGIPPICEIAPYTQTQTCRDGTATAYICRNFACLLPTTDVNELPKLMQEAASR